ncbi:ABC transporter permease [Paraglaciecola arctica]|uniref:Transport permease protein n=1 Tax=Paraglaciecola arctica BSs20135 TaxID=493475 RepID=K6YYE1_9ALTE|nr:ABC transporter permease [Paraglaciecola arctica]GAC21758.1 antibiotic transport system permease protein [Paraglaciecola arctica BSs20135]
MFDIKLAQTMKTSQTMNNSLTMNIMQTLNIYRLESKFEWLKSIRNPSFALPAILFPALFYMFFGVLMNQHDPQAATYLLCSYGTFGIIGPALFSFGAGLAIERGQGWLDIKDASPMPGAAHIVSRLLVSMAFSVMVLMSLGLVAFIFTDVSLSLSQVLTLSTILVFGGLPFCLLGLTLGLLLKAESAPAVVNLVYLPMSFLSGLWIPISMLPDFLQSFAEFLPPYHLSQLALKVVALDSGGSVAKHLAILALSTVIFFVLAIVAFNKKSVR